MAAHALLSPTARKTDNTFLHTQQDSGGIWFFWSQREQFESGLRFGFGREAFGFERGLVYGIMFRALGEASFCAPRSLHALLFHAFHLFLPLFKRTSRA
jgi:hypothetical protein